MSRPRPASRLPFLLLAAISLLVGLWTGLARLEWMDAAADLRLFHAPLLICGFLGTVIGLERAVALGASWAYGAPLLSGLGGVGLLAWRTSAVGPILLVLGSALLVAVFVAMLHRERALHTLIMAVAAVLWLVGNSFWLIGVEIPELIAWWMGFLILTIAAERLELTRVLPLSRSSRLLFLASCVLLLAGILVRARALGPGSLVMGASFFLIAGWLLRYDVARHTVRKADLPRFIAVCLLAAYGWLAIAGVLWLAHPDAIAGPAYDAVVHAVLLGFVFTMIFGHAPIIFPAVLGLAIPFRPAFYVHVLLLHASLLLRVGADLTDWPIGRQWAGLVNAAAILIFVLNTLRAAMIGMWSES